MINRHRCALTALLLGLAAPGLPAWAQDATKEPAKPSTQSGPSPKSPSAQECRDRMHAKGDAASAASGAAADLDKACIDMRKNDASKTTKTPGKSGSESGEMPAGPSASKPGAPK